jgi:hypothetical protein
MGNREGVPRVVVVVVVVEEEEGRHWAVLWYIYVSCFVGISLYLT